ncbi:hypothetical protein FHW58_005020 [Duganella sp. 1224]|uniref:VOC family protein n=1 Tax=Duganella sp. 1224 TaxID=2587052 RepID=UPI0015C8ED9E|nr:VOC family protein [Duganella sp. 1224]NYE63786.1 hypothetical protein [Duganella sp. 1224]
MQHQRATVGMPDWVTLTTTAPARARQFYADLLGWHVPAEPDTVCRLNGQPVASIVGATDGVGPAWRLHVQVAEVGASVARALAAGGKLLTQTDGAAVLADHAGVELVIWQRAAAPDQALRGVPGALVWSELIVDDVGAAAAFYGQLFGWTLSAPAADDPFQRRQWLLDGRPVAGLLPRPPAMPADMPPYWDVYFGVAALDGVAETVERLGGVVLLPSLNTAHGQIAVFLDPAASVFSVRVTAHGAGVARTA